MAKKITLITDLPAQPTGAVLDPDRISQVLSNLLSNAHRYTPEGGRITLSLKQQGSELWVSVADTGPGIKPEELPYVFERFWWADKSRARATGGSGLGLAIAKHFVEAHNGRAWVESTPGQGATFTFSLPTSLSV